MRRTHEYITYVHCPKCGWEQELDLFVVARILPQQVGRVSVPMVCLKCEQPYEMQARWSDYSAEAK